MIDEGIACNLEESRSELTQDERSLLRRCDVLLSTGVIGYVTDKTVSPILDEFGRDANGALGPVAVMSVLELFDADVIPESFVEHGYRFGQLPVRMPQRRFADEEEREGVLETLQDRGESTEVQESEDRMFASLCVAAYPESFDVLTQQVTDVAESLSSDVRAGGQEPTILQESALSGAVVQ
jgi:carnitine O-acetyltransferase